MGDEEELKKRDEELMKKTKMDEEELRKKAEAEKKEYMEKEEALKKKLEELEKKATVSEKPQSEVYKFVKIEKKIEGSIEAPEKSRVVGTTWEFELEVEFNRATKEVAGT